MDRKIVAEVNGSYIRTDNHIAGVQGEANSTVINFIFDESWSNFAKSVTFYNSRGENPVEIVFTTDKLTGDITDPETNLLDYSIPIPGEAMEFGGEIEYVIDGYIDDKRYRSVTDSLTVKFSSVSKTPIEPTPTQVEQLQLQIDTLIDDIHAEAVDAAKSADEAAKSASDAADSALASEEERKKAETAKEDAETERKAAETAKEDAETAQKKAEEAEDGAEKARQAIEDMTATGDNVPHDSTTPIVEKSVNKDGSVNLHFNIRQGKSGVYVGTGEMPEGYNVQIDPTGEEIVDITAGVIETWTFELKDGSAVDKDVVVAE